MIDTKQYLTYMIVLQGKEKDKTKIQSRLSQKKWYRISWASISIQSIDFNVDCHQPDDLTSAFQKKSLLDLFNHKFFT